MGRMGWLANPDWAVALVLVGVLLIYAEFNRPGTVAFGCGGALAVMLGVWGLGHAPVGLVGLGFVALGIAMLALGCGFPLRGLTTVTGAACLYWGLSTLTAPPVRPGIALAVALIFSTVTTWLGRVALLARRKKQVPGAWDRDSRGFVRIRMHSKE